MRSKIIKQYLIQFLLSILLFIFVFLSITKFIIFNPTYIKYQMNQKKYYQEVYQDMNDTISNYIVQSGLPDQVLKNIYTIKTIKKDINHNITRIYQGKKMKLNTNQVKEKLNKNINQYLEKENIEISDQDSLDRFTTQIVEQYQLKITLNNYLVNIGKIVLPINIIVTISIIVLIVIIVFLYKKNKSIFEKENKMIPLFTTAGLLFVVAYFLEQNMDIQHFMIWNKNTSMILKTIIGKYLQGMKISSIMIVIIPILLYIVKNLNLSWLKIKRGK